jgi:AcrR family transcriptional regulator
MNGFEKRTEVKKHQIIEATFQMMNTDKGIANVRMDEIAKIAGVGKTTIFKYFGSKEELIKEVFRYFFDLMGNTTKAIMDKGMSFEDTLIAMSNNKIKYLQEINHRFYLDMMEYFTGRDEQGDSIIMKQYTQESFGIMLDLFHRGKKEGKVDLKYSDEFLLVYFQALIEGISNPKVYDRIVPYTTQWTEMMIKGLAPAK